MMGMEKVNQPGSTLEWDDYLSGEYGNTTRSDQQDDEYTDDFAELENADKSKQQWAASVREGDRFGGSFQSYQGDGKWDDDRVRGFTDGEKRKGAAAEGLVTDDADDAADAAGGEGGSDKAAFRDNLSDADATHLCQEWRTTYNVVLGTSWGSMPFDLQQKWLQYACDYLLKQTASHSRRRV
jgi:hypothetical protein